MIVKDGIAYLKMKPFAVYYLQEKKTGLEYFGGVEGIFQLCWDSLSAFFWRGGGGGGGVGGSNFFFFMQKKGAFKFTDQVNKRK